MSDQERTYAQIITDLADNDEQDISAQDVRQAIITALGGYGSIYVVDGSTPQGSLTNTPTKLLAFTTDGEHDNNANVVSDASSDEITVAIAGRYECHLSVSFTGTNTTTFVLGVAVDDIPTSIKAEALLGTSDTVSLSCSGILSLTSGTTVSACVSIVETPVTQTITVKHASLWLKRVG